MNIEIAEQKIFIRRITKDFIDLQDSNEQNFVEQILSLEILKLKLQEVLNQIETQIQSIQERLTLTSAYKDQEYSFLFEKATTIEKILKQIEKNLPKLEIQRKYLKQILEIVTFYIKESNLGEY